MICGNAESLFMKGMISAFIVGRTGNILPLRQK